MSSKERKEGSHRRSSSTGAGAGTGGLLGFLRTELDSFVRGLHGQSEDSVPTCTHMLPSASSHDPPKKRQKRSHEPVPAPRPTSDYADELDAIRQHTAHRYSAQDYAPLTEANLRASTSRVLVGNQQAPEHGRRTTSPSKPHHTSREPSATTRLPRSSLDKPLPPLSPRAVPLLSSPPASSSRAHNPDDAAAAQQTRRRKRERAATFVNDEEARQVLLRQIAEQEDREAEVRRLADERVRQLMRQEREREARETRRRQERADALARLEAQDAMDRQSEDEQRLAVIRASAQAQAEAEAKAAAAAERARDEQDKRRRQLEREHRAREKERARLDQEARARQALAVTAAEEEARARSASLEVAAKEKRRVAELEAEVAKLRAELEAAKEQNEQNERDRLSAMRQVHFAPTPPASDRSSVSVLNGPGQPYNPDASFLSISSNSSYVKVAPPPPPPPPPPPIASEKRISPLQIIAARKAALKSTPPRKKPPANGIASVPNMPLDMGKFLNEMKNTKLRKVGLPSDSKRDKKDEEESGLKSVLENVLKKRFVKKDDRSSASTADNPANWRSNLSSSTTSSITSFSSYRPTDWSFELDNAPMPPTTTRLRGSASSPHISLGSRHGPQASVSSLPEPPKPILPSAIKLSRTLSHPSMGPPAPSPHQRSQSKHPNSTSSSATTLVQSTRNSRDAQPSHLAKVHARPNAAFGHALTNEEPQRAGRTKAQPYAHHKRQSSNATSTCVASLASSPSTIGGSSSTVLRNDLPQPRMPISQPDPKCASHFSVGQPESMGLGSKQSSRTAGSSFDVDVYAQMQLKEEQDDEELEGALWRRSLSDPPRIDGMMDLPSPTISLSFLDPRPSSRFEGRKVSTSKIPRSDSLQAVHQQPLNEAKRRPDGTALANMRKASDGLYTHPRPAPVPPSATQASYGSIRRPSHTDAMGRPLSPSKARARLVRAERGRHDNVDDEVLLRKAGLSEEDALRLLQEEDSFLVGYGSR